MANDWTIRRIFPNNDPENEKFDCDNTTTIDPNIHKIPPMILPMVSISIPRKALNIPANTGIVGCNKAELNGVMNCNAKTYPTELHIDANPKKRNKRN
jgi:hypothetical protein